MTTRTESPIVFRSPAIEMLDTDQGLKPKLRQGKCLLSEERDRRRNEEWSLGLFRSGYAD
jgi:hypothetical protein